MGLKWLALALSALMIPAAGLAEMRDEPPPTVKMVGSGRLMETLAGAAPGELGIMIFGSRTLETGSQRLNDDVVCGFRVEAEDGCRTYRFELAEGLAFSDGTPITAENYVFSVLLSCSGAAAELGLGRPDAFYDGLEEYEAGGPFTGVRLYSEREFSLCLPEDLRGESQWTQLDVIPYPIHEIAPECRVRDDGQGAYLTEALTADGLESALLDAETGYLVNPAVSSGLYRVTAYNPHTREIWLMENEYRQVRGGIVRMEDGPVPLAGWGPDEEPDWYEPVPDPVPEPIPEAASIQVPAETAAPEPAETAVKQPLAEVTTIEPDDIPLAAGGEPPADPDADPGVAPLTGEESAEAAQPGGAGLQEEDLREEEPDEAPSEEEAHTVDVRIVTEGDDLQFGDVVTLVAELHGYEEDAGVSVQWQCDDGSGWKDVAGGTGLTYDFLITPETYAYRWRAAVISEE
ncbi:MAG: hypothetical protein FWF86_01660 [Clostridia bacterium]|nr:hypothetical protein [Clostridia bacterium]